MQTVAGKKVLITGAAMGMGKMYGQLAVAENAAAVVLWDINQQALDATVAELRRAGGKVHPYVVDVSSREAIEHAAKKVLAEVGEIDILINNAGIVRGKFFWEHDNVKDTFFTMAVNSLALMYITRAFLPGMIASRSEARIVNIASAAGLVANPRMSVYCASKWAAIGWSDSLRIELDHAGHGNVMVTTVCPGYISTGMFEGVKAPRLTPMLTPEYVVDKVWAAMKVGTPFLTMPVIVRLSLVIKGMLPTRPWDFVAGKIFRVYKSMEEFKGRAT